MRRINYRQERKKKRTKRINHLIVALIIILGLAMVCIFNMDRIESFMANYVQTVELTKSHDSKSKHKASFNYHQVKPVSPVSIAEAYAKSKDYRPVAQLAIDGLNVHQNIYEGVGNVELNLGLGTLKPNQKLGKKNYAVAGHNMDDGKSYLSPLYTAKNNDHLIGQTIYVTDFKKVYYYKIIDSNFISKYDTQLVSDHGFKKNSVITLITCDSTGSGRLYVLGSYMGSMNLNKAPKNVRNSFVFK